MTSFASFQIRGAAVIAAAYGLFLVLMLDGLTLGQHSAGQMALILVGSSLLLALVFGVLWSQQMHQDGKRTRADEREELIETSAERAGYYILDAAIFGLLVLALSDANWKWLGSFTLTRPEGLVFALVMASVCAGLGRFVAGFIAARRL